MTNTMTEWCSMADARKLPQTDQEPRCWRCNRKLAELVSRPWTIVCGRCKARNQSAAA